MVTSIHVTVIEITAFWHFYQIAWLFILKWFCHSLPLCSFLQPHSHFLKTVNSLLVHQMPSDLASCPSHLIPSSSHSLLPSNNPFPSNPSHLTFSAHLLTRSHFRNHPCSHLTDHLPLTHCRIVKVAMDFMHLPPRENQHLYLNLPACLLLVCLHQNLPVFLRVPVCLPAYLPVSHLFKINLWTPIALPALSAFGSSPAFPELWQIQPSCLNNNVARESFMRATSITQQCDCGLFDLMCFLLLIWQSAFLVGMFLSNLKVWNQGRSRHFFHWSVTPILSYWARSDPFVLHQLSHRCFHLRRFHAQRRNKCSHHQLSNPLSLLHSAELCVCVCVEQDWTLPAAKHHTP